MTVTCLKWRENGEYFDGVHEEIIDKELFFILNRIEPKREHGRISKTDKVYLLRRGLSAADSTNVKWLRTGSRKRTGDLVLMLSGSPSEINAKQVLETIKDFSGVYDELSNQDNADYESIETGSRNPRVLKKSKWPLVTKVFQWKTIKTYSKHKG